VAIQLLADGEMAQPEQPAQPEGTSPAIRTRNEMHQQHEAEQCQRPEIKRCKPRRRNSAHDQQRPAAPSLYQCQRFIHRLRTWRSDGANAIDSSCRFCCLLFRRSLLAVAPMNVPVLLLVLAAAAPPAPLGPMTPATPMTEVHRQDIGCVALLGLVADLQRRGAPYAAD